MKIKKLSLKNIRSYSESEITFPDGSILLSGDIGSGKTTILLAIEFALFGLQPGQKASGLLSNSSDQGQVALELEIGNSNVLIERTLKRGSKSISHEDAAITIDGAREDLSVTELKMRILKLINYPEEFVKKTNVLYRYTVYSPQEEMKQIITEDPESRLNIIRHIFGIEKYKKIRENILLISLKLREESRILTSELRTLDADKIKIENSKSLLSDLAKNLASKDKLLVEKKSERKSMEIELKELESKISEKRNFEKEAEKAQVLLATKIQQDSEKSTEIKELEEKISLSSRFDVNILDNLLLRIAENEKRKSKATSDYIELSGRLKSIEIKKNDGLEKRKRIFNMQMCPTCLQDVSEFHKHNIINDVDSTIVSLDKELPTILADLERLKSVQESLIREYSDLSTEKSRLEILRFQQHEQSRLKEQHLQSVKIKESLTKDIEFLNNHLTSLKNSILEFSKYDNAFKLNDSLLKKMFNDEKKLEIEIAELRKEDQLIKKDISLLQEAVAEKEKLRDKISSMVKMESWLSQDFLNLLSFTEKSLLSKLREEFSRLFNKWFSILTTDSFYVQLDETFTPIILQGDYELDYSFLSGGERTAVALAYRLALNQTINSIFSRVSTKDLLILDEPTDGFSEQQLDKVRDILHELNVKQLILVSHEQKIEGFVDHVIKLKKDVNTRVENQKP